MDYVIFDLEWNQCPYGKGKENPKLPFEIIEIGAVKMDGERNVLGTFHRIVKPVVYQHLHHRTREVVGLTEEDLQNGIPFAQAVQEFFAFSGGACMFGTWGPGDLTELQRNMKFYNLLSLIRGPIHFYDVQKLFAIQYETMKSRRALEYAADFLHLPKDEHFHQALSDAKYTADIFARIDMDVVLAYDSIDVYQNPKKKKDELFLSYPDHDQYVSREFTDRDKIMRDREVTSTKCPICHLPAKRKIRWFMNNSKAYESISLCQKHGYVKGKIRIRHTEEDRYYVIKTLKNVGNEKAEEIREKRDSLRKKRQIKRKSEKQI